MKHSSLIIGIICLLLHAAICLLLSAVGNNTLLIGSLVIVSTFLLIFLLGASDIRDGFKVSLPFFLVFNGIIEYILSYFVGETLTDNGFIIAIIVLFVIQVVVAVSAYLVSKANDKRG